MKKYVANTGIIDITTAITTFCELVKVEEICIWQIFIEENGNGIGFDYNLTRTQNFTDWNTAIRYANECKTIHVNRVSYDSEKHILHLLVGIEEDFNEFLELEQIVETLLNNCKITRAIKRRDTMYYENEEQRIARLYMSLTQYDAYTDFIERCEEFNLESEKCSFEQYVNWYNQTWICEYNEMFK